MILPTFTHHCRGALLFCLAPQPFTYWAITIYGATFQLLLLKLRMFQAPHLPRRCRQGIQDAQSSAFNHLYWPNHCCFLFLRLLECFNSPRVVDSSESHGRPSGSKAACAYPEHFAACHGPTFLPKPSHPLNSFNNMQALRPALIHIQADSLIRQ